MSNIQYLKKKFNCDVGLSDHSLSINSPLAAVALGAKVIEKHFTLDRKMKGPDHKASLEPHEFKLMVKAIRNIEKALGNGLKKPSKSELKLPYYAVGQYENTVNWRFWARCLLLIKISNFQRCICILDL